MTPTVAALPPEQALFVLAARLVLFPKDRMDIEYLLSRELNWPLIKKRSTTLGISSLLYKHICDNKYKSLIPGDIWEYLDEEYRRISIKNIRNYSQLSKIIAQTGQSGISLIGLKGIFLANYLYKDIGLRQMEDMDLLCRTSDLSTICHILLNLGYHQKQIVFQSKIHEQIFIEKNEHLPPFSLEGYSSVEVHFKLFSHCDASHCPDMTNIWTEAVSFDCSGQPLYALSPEDQLLHLLVHLHAHFYKSALIFPLYWFCDIHEWIHQHKNCFNWDRFLKKSRQFNMENQVSDILGLMVTCWNTQIPASVRQYINDLNEKKGIKNEKDDRFLLENFFRRNDQGDVEKQQRSYVQVNLEKIKTEKKIRGNMAAIYLLLNFLFPPREYLIQEHQIRNPHLVIFYHVIHPCKIFSKAFTSLVLNLKKSFY